MAEILDSLNINNDIQSVSQADEALIADTQASVVGLFGLTALVTKLNTLLEGVINANKNKLNGKYYTEYTAAELKNILEQVLKTLNDIDFTLKNATKPTLIYGYNSGSTTANQLLAAQLDVLTNAGPGDSKALKRRPISVPMNVQLLMYMFLAPPLISLPITKPPCDA